MNQALQSMSQIMRGIGVEPGRFHVETVFRVEDVGVRLVFKKTSKGLHIIIIEMAGLRRIYRSRDPNALLPLFRDAVNDQLIPATQDLARRTEARLRENRYEDAEWRRQADERHLKYYSNQIVVLGQISGLI